MTAGWRIEFQPIANVLAFQQEAQMSTSKTLTYLGDAL